MIREGTINPLNVHDLRSVGLCPPHFVKVVVELKTTTKVLTDWIYENLEGRFYTGSYYEKKGSNYDLMSVFAFEIPAEASYFAICLDQINKA